MTMSLKRIGMGILILTLSLTFIVGCGQKSQKADGIEIELFAKAQELQKKEKYDDAVNTYRQIVREYPKTRHGANSQFMIGYIYANHLKDYEQARIELNRYLKKFTEYSDSGLIAGAKFELENLGKSIDEIPIMTEIGSDTTQSDNTTSEEPVKDH